jgi:hypothetical protein
MSSPERPSAGATSTVFPIAETFFRGKLALWNELDGPERAALSDGNLEALDPDDPTHFLLMGNIRPDEEVAQSPDYRSGVCLASAAIRRQIRTMRESGAAVPEPVFDPSTFVEGDPSMLTTRWPLPSFLRQRIHKMNEIAEGLLRTTRYVEGSNGKVFRISGLLRGSIMIQDMPFISERHMEFENPRAFTLGIADTLVTYHGLYGGPLQEATLLGGDSFGQFERDAKKDSWPTANLPRKAPSYEALNGERPDLMHTRRLETSYTGVLLDDDGRKREKREVQWNNQVPAQVRLTRVGRFLSSPAIVASENGMELREVGERALSCKLAPSDTLIIKGKEDSLLTLGYPFMIEPQIVDASGTVQLLRLCRPDGVIDLSDRHALTAEQQARYEALSQRISDRNAAIQAYLAKKTLGSVFDRSLYPGVVALTFGSSLGLPLGEVVSEAVHMEGAKYPFVAACTALGYMLARREVRQSYERRGPDNLSSNY